MIWRTTIGIPVCGIVVLMNTFNVLAAERPAVTELLKPLNLSGYSSNLHPPDFSGVTAYGKTASLAELRGRVLLLNFWATWCQECRTEMAAFERLHRELTPQGLSVLGINAREGSAAIRTYATEVRLTFPLILDPKGTINAAYGVIGLPTTFLIGRDGRPVALAIGPREWTGKPARALIEALIAERVVLKGTH